MCVNICMADAGLFVREVRSDVRISDVASNKCMFQSHVVPASLDQVEVSKSQKEDR